MPAFQCFSPSSQRAIRARNSLRSSLKARTLSTLRSLATVFKNWVIWHCNSSEILQLADLDQKKEYSCRMQKKLLKYWQTQRNLNFLREQMINWPIPSHREGLKKTYKRHHLKKRRDKNSKDYRRTSKLRSAAWLPKSAQSYNGRRKFSERELSLQRPWYPYCVHKSRASRFFSRKPRKLRQTLG